MSLPLHPAIVHLPIGGAVLGLPLALGILWLVSRGAPRRTWILAGLVQTLSFGGALVALNSGEEMEERVEDEIPAATIHAHEANAQRFAVGLGLSSVLLIAAAFAPSRFGRLADGTALASSALALGLAIPTGHSGGEMVYGTADAAFVDAPRGRPEFTEPPGEREGERGGDEAGEEEEGEGR